MALGHAAPMARFAFDAIGTSWEIDTPAPLTTEVKGQILALVERFDHAYSRFRNDSLVTRIGNAAEGGSFAFPSDAGAMFDLYDRLHAATGGAVDPLVGRELELFGYDRDYTLVPDRHALASMAGRPNWTRDVQRCGNVVATRQPLLIDVGAVGKGRLVDLVVDLMASHGLEDFVVDGSGDMRHWGESALDVGLEHPLDPTMVVGVARLKNAALCASASNRRRWGDGLHHVLDGRTGQPTTEVVATWAVAADTATADGLATALFFRSSSHLSAFFPFASVRIFADGTVEVSDNFEGEIFT